MTYSIFTETTRRFDPMTGEPDVRFYHWIQADGQNVALMHTHQEFRTGLDLEPYEDASARSLELAQQIVAALNASQSSGAA